MTPHHSDYYTRTDKDHVSAPSDFDDPVPVSFLSLGTGGVFHVAVTCDIPDEEGRKWTDLVLELVEQALEHWGVGAKTNAGYGRLEKDAVSISRDSARTVREEVRKGFETGDKIKVKRVETPPKKKFIAFVASDGTKCQVLQQDDPCKDVPIGEEVELWVVNAQSGMYTLSSKEPKAKAPARGKRHRRR